MKEFHGVIRVAQLDRNKRPLAQLKPADLAACLSEDLQACVCTIYGDDGQSQQAVLAKLFLLPETLYYHALEHRLELAVAGPILRNDCPPLTYRLQGKHFAVTGRCSMIPKVCGVDLYLQASYTGELGAVARQRFAFDVKKILQTYK